MSDTPIAPTEATPAPPAGDPAPAPAAALHPLFTDATGNTLAADFATRLGPDVADYAEVINQRFGGQDIAKLVKSYGEANKMISEGGRPIGYPAPDSPPEAWAKWNKANGVPETPADYKLFSEAQQGVDPEIVGKFQKAFHDEKVPPALAQRMAARYAEIEAEVTASRMAEQKATMDAAQADLQKQWGADYEVKMDKLKGVVASQGYDPGDPELFDNPKVVGFLAKVAGMLGEDTVASLRSAAVATGAYRGDPAAEARRIMSDPTHPEHAAYLIAGPNDPVAVKVRTLLQQRG